MTHTQSPLEREAEKMAYEVARTIAQPCLRSMVRSMSRTEYCEILAEMYKAGAEYGRKIAIEEAKEKCSEHPEFCIWYSCLNSASSDRETAIHRMEKAEQRAHSLARLSRNFSAAMKHVEHKCDSVQGLYVKTCWAALDAELVKILGPESKETEV